MRPIDTWAVRGRGGLVSTVKTCWSVQGVKWQRSGRGKAAREKADPHGMSYCQMAPSWGTVIWSSQMPGTFSPCCVQKDDPLCQRHKGPGVMRLPFTNTVWAVHVILFVGSQWHYLECEEIKEKNCYELCRPFIALISSSLCFLFSCLLSSIFVETATKLI